MKKTAFTTSYYINNYGTLLQAFATQEILKKLGYDPELIRVDGFWNEIEAKRRAYFVKKALTSSMGIYKCGVFFSRMGRRFGVGHNAEKIKGRESLFNTFRDQYLCFSQKYESQKSLAESVNKNYDAVIVGSDQLWLPGNIAGDYYTLNWVPDTVSKIAFSTSFGQSELPRESEQVAKLFLGRLQHISVREESGQVLVEKLISKKVPITCDPTMLFSGDEWRRFAGEQEHEQEPYILCYFLGKNPVGRRFAKRLSEYTGLRIISLPHLDEYISIDEKIADELKYDVDPFSFVDLICRAHYICTDSFHGSVFSMLFGKQFFAFRRYSRKTVYSTNNRLESLFRLLGMNNRLLSGNERIDYELSNTYSFSVVRDSIQRIREESIQYLRNALQETSK